VFSSSINPQQTATLDRTKSRVERIVRIMLFSGGFAIFLVLAAAAISLEMVELCRRGRTSRSYQLFTATGRTYLGFAHHPLPPVTCSVHKCVRANMTRGPVPCLKTYIVGA
jgi:hypothetical protein